MNLTDGDINGTRITAIVMQYVTAHGALPEVQLQLADDSTSRRVQVIYGGEEIDLTGHGMRFQERIGEYPACVATKALLRLSVRNRVESCDVQYVFFKQLKMEANFGSFITQLQTVSLFWMRICLLLCTVLIFVCYDILYVNSYCVVTMFVNQ